MSDYLRMLEVMSRAADAGAAVIRAGASRRASLTWESKGRADYVSDVDRGAEARIQGVLRASYPDAALIAEESWTGEAIGGGGGRGGAGGGGGGLTFVVDPLDGTTNFLHGFPEYAVSIGALLDSDLVAAVILNAVTGEKYTATAGGGAHSDGQRIRVSEVSEPSRALVGTGFPFGETVELERYTRQFAVVAAATAGIRRPGAAALDFASVACGRFDAFWELELAPWDKAAGILLVREAGGIVTGDRGEDARVAEGGVIAGNPRMHAWLLSTTRSADSAARSVNIS